MKIDPQAPLRQGRRPYMANTLILYKSKYGSAKKYAQWLAEATGAPCVEASACKAGQLADTGTVILCGGVYASGVAGLSFLKKHAKTLAGKKLLILAVGASPYDEKAVGQLRAHNLKGGLESASLFYARGAWDESAMTWKDRTLCKMLQKAVGKQDPAALEPWARALLSAVGQKRDWTDREYIAPLLEELRA